MPAHNCIKRLLDPFRRRGRGVGCRVACDQEEEEEGLLMCWPVAERVKKAHGRRGVGQGGEPGVAQVAIRRPVAMPTDSLT